MKYFKNIKSLSELKTSFKSLAKINHPDAGGSVEIMQEINAEFDVMFSIWKNRTEKSGEVVTETSNSVRSEFYTRNGWKGKNYDISLSTVEIAKRIKLFVKENFPTYKFSVTTKSYSGGSSLAVVLMEAPGDIFDYSVIGKIDKWGEEVSISKQLKKWKEEGKFSEDLNHYNLERVEYLNEVTKDIFIQINNFICSYRYDDSDSMIDYFHTNFYYDLGIGKWDKSFKIVEKQVRLKDTKNSVVVKDSATEKKEVKEISENEYTITKSKHTKTEETIWLVKVNKTLTREEYIEVNKNMKNIGGYYSKFTHSFVFKNNPEKLLEGVA